jgi:hypothetical protein
MSEVLNIYIYKRIQKNVFYKNKKYIIKKIKQRKVLKIENPINLFCNSD